MHNKNSTGQLHKLNKNQSSEHDNFYCSVKKRTQKQTPGRKNKKLNFNDQPIKKQAWRIKKKTKTYKTYEYLTKWKPNKAPGTQAEMQMKHEEQTQSKLLERKRQIER